METKFSLFINDVIVHIASSKEFGDELLEWKWRSSSEMQHMILKNSIEWKSYSKEDLLYYFIYILFKKLTTLNYVI